MEIKTYNGYTYRRANAGEQWVLAGPAQAGPQAVTIGSPDPYKPAAEARANEDQGLQRDASAREAARLRLAEGDNVRNDQRDRVTTPQGLRQEYAKIPEVRSYRIATQQAQAALGTSANPQGDLALTYAFAKAMDPDSVVRNEEQGMVVNSQPWFQSTVEAVKKQFGMDGAGNFTPQARAALRQEVMRSVSSRKPLYDARRAEMSDYAKTYGLDPYEVVGKTDTDIYAPAFRRYAEQNGDEGGVIAGLIGGDPIQRPQQAPTTRPPGMAGYGATSTNMAIPPEMQQAHDAYLQQNWGKLDPRDYAAFRVNLDRQYGFGSNPEGYAESADKLNERAAAGGGVAGLSIPAVEKKLSGLDQFRNNLLSDDAGIGAGVAAGLNAGGLGLPSLFAREQMDALRDEYPIATTIGELGGGVVGTGVAGGLLRGAASRMGENAVAKALSSPLAADIAYGSIYGATQADDPLYGAVGGAAAALAGNRVGRAVGAAFPSAAGKGGAVRALDEAVPTSQQLRQDASRLYDAAENTGERIGVDETFALNDRLSKVLSDEGRLSPTGRLTEVQPRVKEAYQLAGDYAGQEMSPQQVQTIRRVMGDAITSPENDERRIGRLLLGEFDDWTDAAAPGMSDLLGQARSVSSRYLQGDEIELARSLADVRAGQFTNAGQGNALRTDFRQLDRKIAKGQQSFSPSVEAAVADVARGTPTGNFLRNIGRFAPTGSYSAVAPMMAVTGGYGAAGAAGAAAGAGLSVAALLARKAGESITERSAQVAENLAYAGPEYGTALQALLEDAAARGGHGGAAAGSSVSRALLDYSGR